MANLENAKEVSEVGDRFEKYRLGILRAAEGDPAAAVDAFTSYSPFRRAFSKISASAE